jgi:hypothetical protein
MSVMEVVEQEGGREDGRPKEFLELKMAANIPKVMT